STSRLPPAVRFPLLIVLTTSANSILFSLASPFLGLELATISRSLNEPWQVIATLAWAVFSLAVPWVMKLDDLDLACLTILSQAPYYYLLNTFYGISLQACLVPMAISAISNSVPFRLLRPRIASHKYILESAPHVSVANRDILTDLWTRISVVCLGAATYGMVVFASFNTYLPAYLATHFEGLLTFERMYAIQYIPLAVSFLPIGWALYNFLFVPALGAKASPYEKEAIETFDPAQATFAETIYYNIWGWDRGTKTLLQRTAVLVFFAGCETFVRTATTIEGAETLGAAGWAAVWALSGAVTGAVYQWI
ncbi:hypothetical protein K402DRAFT_311293, partial [Aulographum hederae CBS 113979]